MQKFNGKMSHSEAETASEMTSATKITKKSGLSRQGQSPEPFGDSPERGYDGTINDRDNDFNPNPDKDFDDEDAAEEAKANEAKNPANDIYRDPVTGQPFDPNKKFGIIEDENRLISDNITTTYPVNLPTDSYQKYIMENLPKKETGNGKWFIRPHHLETLTNHPLSIKDDILNTRYISHYDQEYGKKKEVNPSEEAIAKIESHLAELKGKLASMQQQRGEDPEYMDELRESMKKEGFEAYEKFINDRTKNNSKQMIIDAYEGVLQYNRQAEKEVLNRERFKEYEKNRPP